MTTARIIKLVHATDGQAMANAIKEKFLAEQGVNIDTSLKELPASNTAAILVFLMTANASSDPRIHDFAAMAEPTAFPLLPVVPDKATYNFNGLPEALSFLGRLNAVGWNEGASPGELVVTAIRRHLGFEPFKRDCKLFISYRREDGGDIANCIHAYFSEQGYHVFLDIEEGEIEPGEPVQPRIHEAIPERDFLLLVDSPGAAESPWVMEEVLTALERRVSVYAVRIPESAGFPLLRKMAFMTWSGDERQDLLHLERFVASGLAARRSFDRRVKQTLRELASQINLEISERAIRRLLLQVDTDEGAHRCLLDFEDAPFDLDRLYRLSRGWHEETNPVQCCLLIHRGLPLSAYEREAVAWASGDEPLEVLALEELLPRLANLAL